MQENSGFDYIFLHMKLNKKHEHMYYQKCFSDIDCTMKADAEYTQEELLVSDHNIAYGHGL